MENMIFPNWDELISRVKKYAYTAEEQERTIRSAAEQLIWAKWHIGMAVREYHEHNDRLGAYGDKITERVAQDLSNDPERKDFKISKREVERCVKFARENPTKETVELLLQSGKTWKQIREGVRDESPEGMEEKKDNTLGISIWSDSKLRTYVEKGVPPEHLEEVTGHLKAKTENDFDMLRMLDDQAVIEIATPVSQLPSSASIPQSTFGGSGIIAMVESWSAREYNAFSEFLKTQPCIVCGQRDNDLFGTQKHHWPRTKGAGGEDWQQVPCCARCHSKFHDQGWDHIAEAEVIRELLKRYAEVAITLLKRRTEVDETVGV